MKRPKRGQELEDENRLAGPMRKEGRQKTHCSTARGLEMIGLLLRAGGGAGGAPGRANTNIASAVRAESARGSRLAAYLARSRRTATEPGRSKIDTSPVTLPRMMIPG